MLLMSPPQARKCLRWNAAYISAIPGDKKQNPTGISGGVSFRHYTGILLRDFSRLSEFQF
jgi:hypothetical protein